MTAELRDPIKVYDARWEAGEFSTEEVRRLFLASMGYARRLNVDTVTIARDARLESPRVMELAIDAALDMGFHVFACPDPISTPQSYFVTLRVTRDHGPAMGLTITASHNPASYVGVKFVVPVVQAIGLDCGPMGGLAEVRRVYHSGERLGGETGGTLELINVHDDYLEFSMEQAGVAPGDLSGLHVVLDGFHGIAGPELMAAMGLAGARVEPLRWIPDGRFPAGSPNPTSRGKMLGAVELARKRGATVVVGVDGDGDRLVFGDGRGIWTAGFAGVPILRAWMARGSVQEPASVLYDPKVNPLALAEWRGLGVRPVLFRNGHSQIKEYMQRTGALWAAEESGHYYFSFSMGDLTVSSENSILTVLLLLKSIHQDPGLPGELRSLEERVATTGEFNYQFSDDGVRDRAMASTIDHFVGQGAEAVDRTPDGADLGGTALSSGVHLDRDAAALEPGWYSGYLRIATNEKGVVRSYFSAGDRTTLARIEGEARRILGQGFGGRVID